jgi:hypothetical protein
MEKTNVTGVGDKTPFPRDHALSPVLNCIKEFPAEVRIDKVPELLISNLTVPDRFCFLNRTQMAFHQVAREPIAVSTVFYSFFQDTGPDFTITPYPEGILAVRHKTAVTAESFPGNIKPVDLFPSVMHPFPVLFIMNISFICLTTAAKKAASRPDFITRTITSAFLIDFVVFHTHGGMRNEI